MEQSRFERMLREGAEKVRELLVRVTNKEFLTFLFFVAISGAFWIMATLNEEYERDISIPVVFTNVPENVVITSDVPSEIKATVTDKGFILYQYIYLQGPQPIKINFTNYLAKGTEVHFSNNELHNLILKNLEMSTKLSSFKPESFDMVYTRGQAKRVPVRMRGNLSAKQQYGITHVTFNPDTITIYAPEDVLDTIHVVFTTPFSYHELEDSLQMETELTPMRNVKMLPATVNMCIGVQQLTQKTVEVPVVPVNVPEGVTLRTFPKRVKVTFQTAISEYEKITNNDFTVELDYSSVTPGVSNATPVITRYPASARHMSLSPRKVEYVIEQQ